MRFRRVLSVLLVAGCLFAFTSLAGSLDSSLSGTPDEVVDVDSGLLPMDSGQVSDVGDSLNEGGDSDSSSVPPQDSPPDESGSPAAKTPGSGEETAASDGEQDGAAGQSADDPGSRIQQADGPGDEAGPGPADRGRTLLGKLLQLLEQLLPVLVGLVLLGALALLVHYRDRLWTAIVRYLGPYVPGGEGTTADDSPLSRPPANGIERAWLEMVRRADVDVNPSATPREYASAAVTDGLNQDPVWELTDLFERVRYGSGQVTTEDVTHAERCLRESAGRPEGSLDD